MILNLTPKRLDPLFNTKDILLIMALPGESKGLFEAEGIPVYYSGIGKVNAAATAMDLIHKLKPKLVVNLGTAGSSKFDTHSLVEVNTFVQRDMDITPLGFKMGETPFDEIPMEIKLETHFKNIPSGVCGTGDTFETGAPKVACDLVDMEGYAIAKVCKKMNVPLLSVKYISDGANEKSHMDWEENLLEGAKKLLSIYQRLIS